MEQLRGHAERTGRGWVIDSFWSAWDAFAGHETYRDAVIAAEGLNESAGGIPAAWLDDLRDRDQIERIL